MVITPLVEPDNIILAEFTFPDTLSELPVAAPNTGVINVGVLAKTTLPLPVAVVDPVPPEVIGRAVPE